jgi:hypothetical protein
MRISRRVKTRAHGRPLGSGNNARDGQCKGLYRRPLAAVLRSPLEAVGQAISAKDASQFDIAYAQLAEACNVCHRNLNHAAIVIKVPDAAMFPDQEFQPPRLRQ